jgi:hypothetical protein
MKYLKTMLSIIVEWNMAKQYDTLVEHSKAIRDVSDKRKSISSLVKPITIDKISLSTIAIPNSIEKQIGFVKFHQKLARLNQFVATITTNWETKFSQFNNSKT